MDSEHGAKKKQPYQEYMKEVPELPNSVGRTAHPGQTDASELCTLLFENSFIRPNLFTSYNLYRPLPLHLLRSGLGDKVDDPNLPLWVLEVMLADQSPLGLKYWFWVRKEIHWRNGKMMNRKIPMSPKNFQKSSDRGNNSKWYIQASR